MVHMQNVVRAESTYVLYHNGIDWRDALKLILRCCGITDLYIVVRNPKIDH